MCYNKKSFYKLQHVYLIALVDRTTKRICQVATATNLREVARKEVARVRGETPPPKGYRWSIVSVTGKAIHDAIGVDF